MTEQAMEKPVDRITITVNQAETEIFMSAGLIRRLAAVATAGDAIAGLYFDVPLQTKMMLEAVMPRSAQGAPKAKACDLDDFVMSVEDGEKLIAWLTEHVLYFFVQNAARMQKDLKSPEALIQKLMGSSTGLPSSPEKSASAGPSIAA